MKKRIPPWLIIVLLITSIFIFTYAIKNKGASTFKNERFLLRLDSNYIEALAI